MSVFGKGLAVAVCLLSATAAMAQSPLATRLRGTITSVDGHTLTVKTRQGGEQTVTLTPDVRLSAPKPLDISDIKPGSFVGTTAIPGRDGNLEALAIVVFPESLRGAGEGHRDWDLVPNSSMTNATVEAVVDRAAGRELQLVYKGGNVKVEVPAKAAIVTPVPAELSDLKPGAPVMINAATPGADGRLTANRLWVGKDGVAPPM